MAKFTITKNRWRPSRAVVLETTGIRFAVKFPDDAFIVAEHYHLPEVESLEVEDSAYIQGWFEGEDHAFYVEHLNEIPQVLEFLKSPVSKLMEPVIVVTESFFTQALKTGVS